VPRSTPRGDTIEILIATGEVEGVLALLPHERLLIERYFMLATEDQTKFALRTRWVRFFSKQPKKLPASSEARLTETSSS